MGPSEKNHSGFSKSIGLWLGILLFSSGPLPACLAQKPLSISQSSAATIAKAAESQIGITMSYDPSYVKLSYPGGDVPKSTGVCTDVVIRALRAIGLDLQKTIHEDMSEHFAQYPNHWGLNRPDRNIDHRRVPNLARYFERHHQSFSVTSPDKQAFREGDIVAWDLGNGRQHIGLVSAAQKQGVPLIIHNIGRGTRQENVLFAFRIIGHYRLKGRSTQNSKPSPSLDS